MKRRIVTLLNIVVIAALAVVTQSVYASAPSCTTTDPFCYEPAALELTKTITSVTEPPIAVPSWLGASQ